MIPETGQLDWDDLDRCLSQHRDQAAGDRRRVQRARDDQRRPPGRRHGARGRAPWPSSTPSITPRTSSSTSGPGAATSWPAPPTSSTGRTSACSTAAASCSRLSTSPSCGPPPTPSPSGWRPAPRTTRGSSGPRRRSNSSPGSPGQGRPGRRRLEPGPCEASPPGERFDALHERGCCSSSGSGTAWAASRGVRLFGPPPSAPRTPTSRFVVERLPSAEVGRRLARRGIFASHGDFYAPDRGRAAGHGRRGTGPARLRLLHDRGRGRPGHRGRSRDRRRSRLRRVPGQTGGPSTAASIAARGSGSARR